jgi:hypothetical protein
LRESQIEAAIVAPTEGSKAATVATSNDTAVAALARLIRFIPSYQRLRCGPYTLNLVGQAIMFGKDRAAYENEVEEHKDEEEFIDE